MRMAFATRGREMGRSDIVRAAALIGATLTQSSHPLGSLVRYEGAEVPEVNSQRGSCASVSGKGLTLPVQEASISCAYGERPRHSPIPLLCFLQTDPLLGKVSEYLLSITEPGQT